MIKPSIGRVVWFWTCAGEAEKPNAQPFAALVTYVHSDDCVNLAVFDREGDHIPHAAIQLWNGEGERPRSLHCEWMPYQKGQAAKQESGIDSTMLANKIAALEAELAGMRNFIASIAKDISERQAAKGAGIPPASNAAVPPPPVLTKNSTSGEDPRKDGTGVG